jgi:epoxyqueuosine reductase
VREIGLAAGLDAVGIAPAAPFVGTRRHLEERRAAGLHGGMNFTYRNPARSTQPERIVDGAAAIVVGARRYPSRGRPPRRLPDESAVDRDRDPKGVVARYASSDHYGPLRRSLAAVAQRLRQEGWQARVVADDNALVDREAAYRAGLGWYGKNTNLLLPGQGSWFVLGSVVTDAPLPPSEVLPDGCGACRRCLPACPTGALVAPGVLDARRCLAWLVQAPGVFPAEYRVALGGRMYGCDDCQEVCPENLAAERAGVGARHDPGPGDQPVVELLAVLDASDEQLLAWLGRWYIPQRQPRYLRRNALVALGNTADGRHPPVEQALRRALGDPDAIIRSHAVWAAARLDRRDLLAAVAGDTDPDVRRELDRAADLT